MPREAIELAAMNLCRDLAPNPRVFEAVPLETYWDLVLTPGAREIYRRAARNAHDALRDGGARERVATFVAVMSVVHPEVDSVAREFRGGPPYIEPADLLIADLAALTSRPGESAEETSLAADRARAAGGF